MRAHVVWFALVACASTQKVEPAPNATATPAAPSSTSIEVDATAQEVDASTADAATDARIDAAPVFDRRRARTLSDDACETDGDCVVTSFFDCCQHCEGPAINPANARKLAARKLACKTHTCPPSRGTYLCGPTPPPDMAAFCHEHRCVAQKIDY